MQPKQATWHWWIVLALAAWVAAGQPGIDSLPTIGGSAPFASPDGKEYLLVERDPSRPAADSHQFDILNGILPRKMPKGQWRDLPLSSVSDLSREPKWVQDAHAAIVAANIPPTKDGQPTTIVISNGKSGYGPKVLNLTVAEFEKLVDDLKGK